MRVAFVGLGKLGLPMALAIEAAGYEVVGVDPSPRVVEALVTGRYPELERDAPGLLEASRIQLVDSATAMESDVCFVVVQTPHGPEHDGSSRLPADRRDFDYSSLALAISELSDQPGDALITVVSTCLPGTFRRLVRPVAARKRVVYNPAFAAMGSVVPDLRDPEFVLIGAEDAVGVEPLRDVWRSVAGDPTFALTDPTTAELAKMAYNAAITQKVVLANALMELAHAVGADCDDVTAVLSLADRRVASPLYLRGGMGDGGPCHPRDGVALSWLAGEVGLSRDVFGEAMKAREAQTEWIARQADALADGSGLGVAVLGRTYKPGTRLVDGSAARLLASILEEWGHQPIVHDPRVDEDERVPFTKPMVFVVATQHPEFVSMAFPPGSFVVDPFRYIPDRAGVTVIRIGEGRS